MAIITNGISVQPIDEAEKEFKKLQNELFRNPSEAAMTSLINHPKFTHDRFESLFLSACVNRNPDLVQLFLDEKVNVHVLVNKDRNCLMYMAECQAYNGTIVKQLFNAGINVNAVDKYGTTAIMLFSCGQGITNRKKGNITAVVQLIRLGADLYLEDYNGKTVLDYATDANNRSKHQSNQEIVKLLEGLMKHYIKLREIEREPKYPVNIPLAPMMPVIPDPPRNQTSFIGPRELENQILEREGFSVRIIRNGRLASSDSVQFRSYIRRWSPDGNITVASWKKIFKKRYPFFDIDILDGKSATGKKLISNLRK
ncbi:MAG: ankyrin repeat domain-containing protein [Geobacter sp.]|nr:ankyrin repeat domain-containing protein [Geobacter sp.]